MLVEYFQNILMPSGPLQFNYINFVASVDSLFHQFVMLEKCYMYVIEAHLKPRGQKPVTTASSDKLVRKFRNHPNLPENYVCLSP